MDDSNTLSKVKLRDRIVVALESCANFDGDLDNYPEIKVLAKSGDNFWFPVSAWYAAPKSKKSVSGGHISLLIKKLKNVRYFDGQLDSIADEYRCTKEQGVQLACYRIMLLINKIKQKKRSLAKWEVVDEVDFNLIEPKWLKGCPKNKKLRKQSKSNLEVDALQLQIKANIWL